MKKENVTIYSLITIIAFFLRHISVNVSVHRFFTPLLSNPLSSTFYKRETGGQVGNKIIFSEKQDTYSLHCNSIYLFKNMNISVSRYIRCVYVSKYTDLHHYFIGLWFSMVNHTIL